jgi:simple sugar transport system ATP-binding protein
VTVVYISSELEEVVRLSDRIVVFKDREKIGEVSNGPWLTVDTIVEMIAADRDDDLDDDD